MTSIQQNIDDIIKKINVYALNIADNTLLYKPTFTSLWRF